MAKMRVEFAKISLIHPSICLFVHFVGIVTEAVLSCCTKKLFSMNKNAHIMEFFSANILHFSSHMLIRHPN